MKKDVVDSENLKKMKIFEEEISKEPLLSISDIIISSFLLSVEIIFSFTVSFLSFVFFTMLSMTFIKDYTPSESTLYVVYAIGFLFAISMSIRMVSFGLKTLLIEESERPSFSFDRLKRMKYFLKYEVKKYLSNIKGENKSIVDLKKYLKNCSEEDLLETYRYYKKSKKNNLLNKTMFDIVLKCVKIRLNISNKNNNIYETYHKTKKKRNQISINKVIIND